MAKTTNNINDNQTKAAPDGVASPNGLPAADGAAAAAAVAAPKRKRRAAKPAGAAAANGAPSGRKLVIVESPAKAKTINKYLGRSYVVRASMGHVRDLPKKLLGVDVEHDFEPTYEPLPDRKKVLAELKKYAATSSEVFLATDLDREGEAIAWHLAQSLHLPPERVRRVVFNEITKAAIQDAFTKPRDLDMNKVNAQQARRILDRIVGYKISPLLWRKVATGISAGRVQSVAVRLIVDRERQIDAFMPEEFWRIGAIFTSHGDQAAALTGAWAKFLKQYDEKGNPPTAAQQQDFLAANQAFRAELVKWKGEKFSASDSQAAIEVAKALGLELEVKQTQDPAAKGPARNRVTVVSRLVAQPFQAVHDGSPVAQPFQAVPEGTAQAGKPVLPMPAFVVQGLSQRESRSRPYAPFTTSVLQQSASVQMHFGAQRTMRVAQQLYEGVEIPGEGSVGLITYMRTDSTVLSSQAIGQVRELIKSKFGDAYLPEKPNFYASGERAQEAHEAIRPTDVSRTPAQLRPSLTDEQFRLYEMIWNRFVACQMPPAVWLVTEADVACQVAQPFQAVPLVAQPFQAVPDPASGSTGFPACAAQPGKAVPPQAIFKAMGRTLKFDGFLKVMGLPKGGEQMLPPLSQQQPVHPVEISPTQHFTQPPPRYTEASLVKALEADGIGRPSTYATIIQTVQDRGYVELIERSFRPTDLGSVVTDKLVKHFPQLFDIRFTAHMEDQLDKIEDNSMDWVAVLREFYGPFDESLKAATEQMVHAKAETQPSEYVCPACGKPMVYRFSKNGRYLACTGYPECKTTNPVDKDGKKIERIEVDTPCPKCGKKMVLRRSRTGVFLGCSDYPNCRGTMQCGPDGQLLKTVKEEDVKVNCSECGAPMAVRWRFRKAFLGCTKYPQCRHAQNLPDGITIEPPPRVEPKPAGVNCPKCGRPMLIRTSKRGEFIACSGFPKCRNAMNLDKLEELKANQAKEPTKK